MKSSNKILVVIIVLVLLLAITGGVFAYTYIATDVFRSDKELFFKYLSQITEEDGFIEKEIEQFNEKKKQNPYENSGEITIEAQYPDESKEEIIEKVNDLSIEFSGSVDNAKQKVQQNVDVNYGDDVVFPIRYIQDGNNYALKLDKVAKQYIAIKNENLDELIKEIFSTTLGVNSEEVEDFSVKLNTVEDYYPNMREILKFTDEEINQLKEIYGTILNNNLLDEYFSREKDGDIESYKLELTAQRIKDIIIKMLEASKENTLLLDKINEVIDELNETAEIAKIDIEEIANLIKDVNKVDISKIPNFEIILTQKNKRLSKIVISQEEVTFSIEKEGDNDGVTYKMRSELLKDMSESNDELSDEDESSKWFNVNLYFNMKYTGLQNLSNVQENYEIGLSISDENDGMEYDYKISNNTEFVDSISIDELNDESAVFLNELKGNQIITILTTVGNKFLEINKDQMAELGLKENENPILYANPIVALGLEIYESASNSIGNVDLSKYER